MKNSKKKPLNFENWVDPEPLCHVDYSWKWNEQNKNEPVKNPSPNHKTTCNKCQTKHEEQKKQDFEQPQREMPKQETKQQSPPSFDISQIMSLLNGGDVSSVLSGMLGDKFGGLGAILPMLLNGGLGNFGNLFGGAGTKNHANTPATDEKVINLSDYRVIN